jgi:hypothetical protein
MRKAEMARAFWRSASGLPVVVRQVVSNSRTQARMAVRLSAMMEAAAMVSQPGEAASSFLFSPCRARRAIAADAARAAMPKSEVAKRLLRKAVSTMG